MPNIDVNIDNFIDHREVSLVGRDNGKACLKKISSSGINFQKIRKNK
jgi:hypothetical protein